MKYFQFSDGHFSCRLKALVLTKFNLQQKAINQTTACVRIAHILTLRVGFEVTVGVWRNHARDRLSIQTTVC